LKLNLGEQEPDVYSAETYLTDGNYHSIKIQRKFARIELFIDEIRIDLERTSNSMVNFSSQTFVQQRRLRIGSRTNRFKWNGIIAGSRRLAEAFFYLISDYSFSLLRFNI